MRRIQKFDFQIRDHDSQRGHGFPVRKEWESQNWESLRTWAGPCWIIWIPTVFPRPKLGIRICNFAAARAELPMAMPVPDRFVLEGIHKDSERMLHIVVRNDPKYAPHNLLSMIQHMPAAQQCSLAAFAECYAESGK